MESAKTSGKDSSRSSVSPMATARTEVVKKEEVEKAMTQKVKIMNFIYTTHQSVVVPGQSGQAIFNGIVFEISLYNVTLRLNLRILRQYLIKLEVSIKMLKIQKQFQKYFQANVRSSNKNILAKPRKPRMTWKSILIFRPTG